MRGSFCAAVVSLSVAILNFSCQQPSGVEPVSPGSVDSSPGVQVSETSVAKVEPVAPVEPTPPQPLPPSEPAVPQQPKGPSIPPIETSGAPIEIAFPWDSRETDISCQGEEDCYLDANAGNDWRDNKWALQERYLGANPATESPAALTIRLQVPAGSYVARLNMRSHRERETAPYRGSAFMANVGQGDVYVGFESDTEEVRHLPLGFVTVGDDGVFEVTLAPGDKEHWAIATHFILVPAKLRE